MRIAILISGRGSNLKALVRASRAGQIHGEVALVLSNVAEAPGLHWARDEGLETVVLEQRAFASREAHDEAIRLTLLGHAIDLVCLAGYMRLVGPAVTQAFAGRILNVHPSLLPAFPGLEAQKQAWAHGVKVTGATVHFVDAELDHGPILAQQPVEVLAGDGVEELTARILEAEHRLYPAAVALVCAGRVRLDGRRALVTEPGR